MPPASSPHTAASCHPASPHRIIMPSPLLPTEACRSSGRKVHSAPSTMLRKTARFSAAWAARCS